jgi:hypothetical protein
MFSLSKASKMNKIAVAFPPQFWCLPLTEVAAVQLCDAQRKLYHSISDILGTVDDDTLQKLISWINLDVFQEVVLDRPNDAINAEQQSPQKQSTAVTSQHVKNSRGNKFANDRSNYTVTYTLEQTTLSCRI